MRKGPEETSLESCLAESRQGRVHAGPTPVFLPRELHRQRSLVGYSPWVCKESDTTEQIIHLITHQDPPILLRSLTPCTLLKAWYQSFSCVIHIENKTCIMVSFPIIIYKTLTFVSMLLIEFE